MANKKYVYPFDEAYGLGKELLGGKGAGLAEMTHIGVPVPEGFTITTEACTLYYDSGKKIQNPFNKKSSLQLKVSKKKQERFSVVVQTHYLFPYVQALESLCLV